MFGKDFALETQTEQTLQDQSATQADTQTKEAADQKA
jgi:hypothetical protein